MIYEVVGKQFLPELTERLLADNSVDGGVVRNCFSIAEVLLLEKAHRLQRDGMLSTVVSQLLPEMEVVSGQVVEHWSSHGYSDYKIDPTLHYTDYVHAGRGIAPHIDYYDNVDLFIQASLSFSVSVGQHDSGAVVKVSRPQESQFNKEQGNVDVAAILKWQESVANDEVVWSETTIGCGDLFVIPQHPSPTGHGVISTSLREAYILDYLAFKK